MIKLNSPYIDHLEKDAVSEVLDSGYLTQSAKTVEFEDLVKEYTNISHAFATSSATTGLHLSLVALGIGPGDEVIVPAFSFPATANVVVQCGATPVFADIELPTFVADPKDIARKISKRTKAIMPIHAFGLSSDIRAIVDIARSNNLYVVEDAATGLGSTVDGMHPGSISDIAVFSFHPRKIITTGEGGMVLTNSDKLAEKIQILRSHGAIRGPQYMKFIDSGFNYRLSDINSAVGCAQMSKLNHILKDRQRVAEIYHREMADIAYLTLPEQVEGFVHTYQSFVVLLDTAIERDHVIVQLKERGIESTLGTYGQHLQPFYENLLKSNFSQRFRRIDRLGAPNATIAHNSSLSIPISTNISESEIKLVASSLRQILLDVKR
jgi:perosamine synthetase